MTLPPPPLPDGHGHIADQLAALRHHPGQWAVVARYPLAQRQNAGVAAYSVRTGRTRASQPPGAFQARSRTQDGETLVEACYAPDGIDTPEPGAALRDTELNRRLAALREQPGTWDAVADYPAGLRRRAASRRADIRAGILFAARPAGSFHALTTTVRGRTYVLAVYLGSQP